MKPEINDTAFGQITVAGEVYDHDILIRADGTVKKRKKKLSKEVYGTSHILSLAEAEYILEEGAAHLVIGSGQEGMLKLSSEAEAFFAEKGCTVELLPTPQAAKRWNKLTGQALGLFHITC